MKKWSTDALSAKIQKEWRKKNGARPKVMKNPLHGVSVKMTQILINSDNKFLISIKKILQCLSNFLNSFLIFSLLVEDLKALKPLIGKSTD